MPFDRAGAKAAGYTDQEIDAYLGSPQSQADAVNPRPPMAQTSREIMAQGGPRHPYSGGPDAAGLETPSLMGGYVPADPVEIPSMLLAGPMMAGRKALFAGGAKAAQAGGKAVAETAGPVIAGAAKRYASSPEAQMLGEAAFNSVPNWIKGPIKAFAKYRGLKQAAKKAADDVASKAAEEGAAKAAASAMKPIVGGEEAEAFRKGGMKAVEEVRQAAKDRIEVAAHTRARPAARPKGKPSGPPRSNLKLVKPKPKGPPGTTKPRHDVQYFSKSRGEHIDIEGMNQKHIEQAYRKLAATNPKAGSVARRQMDALMDETKHRALDKGVHIGQAEPKGPPGTERVGAAERAASNRQAAKNLRRHPAANEKTGAAVERTVVSPDQVAKSAKIQTWMDQQGLDPAAQAEMWRQILAGGLSP